MSVLGLGRSSPPEDEGARFYRVELFQCDLLIELQFFDSEELQDAKRWAIAAVTNGVADHAEVRDDQSRLIFDR